MKQSRSIHLRLDSDLLNEIDEFTKEYYFTNRTDAMRFLIVNGLKYQKLSDDLLEKRITEREKKLFNGN